LSPPPLHLSFCRQRLGLRLCSEEGIDDADGLLREPGRNFGAVRVPATPPTTKEGRRQVPDEGMQLWPPRKATPAKGYSGSHKCWDLRESLVSVSAGDNTSTVGAPGCGKVGVGIGRPPYAVLAHEPPCKRPEKSEFLTDLHPFPFAQSKVANGELLPLRFVGFLDLRMKVGEGDR
jgi:hypothetical protein